MSGPHTPFVIKEVYAAVSIAADGDEGVCAVQVAGVWPPLIAADQSRLDWIKQAGTDLGRHYGMKVRLIKLSTREDVETLFEGRHNA